MVFIFRPAFGSLGGTVCFLDAKVGDLIEARMKTLCEAIVLRSGLVVDLDYRRPFQPLVNAGAQTRQLAEAARLVLGNVDTEGAHPWAARISPRCQPCASVPLCICTTIAPIPFITHGFPPPRSFWSWGETYFLQLIKAG